MKENFIKFRSITQAIKAKNILKKLKIKSNLERTSGNKTTNGCGFKLKFNHDINQIKKLLIDNNVIFID